METRIIELTEAAARHGNLNLRPCGKDFFPEDVFGGSSKAKGIGIPVRLNVKGLPQPVETDIPTDGASGKPRWIFRERAWVKAFVKVHGLTPGDIVSIHRSGKRTYSLAPLQPQSGKKVASPKDIPLEAFGLSKLANDKAVEDTKESWLQHTFDVIGKEDDASVYGTFKDSLNAPVHRWFKYPAGYSYRLVERKIKTHRLTDQHWILDPFVGSGTTCLEAKRHGVNSIGIEAHPFVHWVAAIKIDWSVSVLSVAETYMRVVQTARRLASTQRVDVSDVPELVRKCYSVRNLGNLICIKDAIRQESPSSQVRGFLELALTDTLRNASKAATGWPYIAPAKMHQKAVERGAFSEFQMQVRRMVDDLKFVQTHYSNRDVLGRIVLGDARNLYQHVKPESIDLTLTSPPYLNNYDYADRTRLETYFLGWYDTWNDISKNVRDKLIVSATTQIRRTIIEPKSLLTDELKTADPDLSKELADKIAELSVRREHKGGKKSYDLMVAGYFNDMFQTLRGVYVCLKPSCDFVLVVGDSAPYGVHIPTHEYLARYGLAVGFSRYEFEHLRTRGDKWPGNPQRHKVKLTEVILTLSK